MAVMRQSLVDCVVGPVSDFLESFPGMARRWPVSAHHCYIWLFACLGFVKIWPRFCHPLSPRSLRYAENLSECNRAPESAGSRGAAARPPVAHPGCATWQRPACTRSDASSFPRVVGSVGPPRPRSLWREGPRVVRVVWSPYWRQGVEFGPVACPVPPRVEVPAQV